ncbi:hypothetical protein Bsp3421_000358 (plasmid) [Burkholderia sp. FERM BP-3421]|uniref:hypothetical protein n=1 Tax=Burkholderia sp. FERM BP-3421 TaxID=1494466 RepID=UPI002361D200|nr:hypothetical protein [Burkholderia sp. FERM BP-3421]WDD90510.1 hypothetical protein Bsp3421_000358 [Burkholderia sp. FERM BP-3421]
MSTIVAIALTSLIFSLGVVLPRIISAARGDAIVTDGVKAVAEVVEIGQTGVTLNQVPQMRMVLRISDHGVSRDVTIRQYVDLGNMPRAGERVRVVIDARDPARVTYLGLARAQ